jgi:hypothetical protein
MRNKAELLDWYRNLWLFASERQQKNYMLDVNLEEPTPVDTALSQSGFALGTAELAAKKVLHAPAPSPPENPEPPVRRELSLTAGSKRARSWPAAAAPRKSGAPSPRPETRPFGLLNHGVQSKPEVSELIASVNQTDDEAEFRKRQQDLISKLIGGELSSDEEPAAEEKNETEQPAPEEKAEDREEGEIPATQTYPEAENEMLAEERSSSPEGLEPEEPAKDANGYYTFKGFTLSVKEKPASEPSPQLKLKTSRLKRETYHRLLGEQDVGQKVGQRDQLTLVQDQVVDVAMEDKNRRLPAEVRGPDLLGPAGQGGVFGHADRVPQPARARHRPAALALHPRFVEAIEALFGATTEQWPSG